MENNFFIFSDRSSIIELERFHICTWEFKNSSALIEFGGEIENPQKYDGESISLYLYIPWITNKHIVKDLYDKLKESENSKFIFNDSVSRIQLLDDGQQKDGVILEFTGRSPLCIIPIRSSIDEKNKTISIDINLKPFKEKQPINETNLYFRFYIEPNISLLSTRKTGISRSTIIYDIKINEKRNLPYSEIDLRKKALCDIKKCFCFNILPNSYDFTFLDVSTLQNIRTLEFDSFKKYLGDNRVKKNELVVVFNKKASSESYVFFSVYSKERIGSGQFALAIFVNLICGILIFLASYRSSQKINIFSNDFWLNLPYEIYISIFISLLIGGYFFLPQILKSFQWVKSFFGKGSK